jgi:hypothetical protein
VPWLALSPAARKISESSIILVGQISGQWVKPKKTSIGAPSNWRLLTLLPSMAVNSNGPPTELVRGFIL